VGHFCPNTSHEEIMALGRAETAEREEAELVGRM